MNPIMIDVREKDEFAAEHVEHSINLPLSEFERQAPALFKNFSGKEILLMCRSGKRAALAAAHAKAFPHEVSLRIYEGGILEWKNQGKPTTQLKKAVLPIMRQVQLVAGTLAVTGSALAYWVHPNFVAIPAFVGLGLAFAGATGFCGMAEILMKMPWNKNASTGEGERNGYKN